MKTKLILLAILSLVLFSSCMSESERRQRAIDNREVNRRLNETPNEFIERDLNSLQRPVTMVAKSKIHSEGRNDYYSIVVKAGNDSLVSYTGKSAEMIQAIGDTFNVNDTICK
jgi:hypothetical protein